MDDLLYQGLLDRPSRRQRRKRRRLSGIGMVALAVLAVVVIWRGRSQPDSGANGAGEAPAGVSTEYLLTLEAPDLDFTAPLEGSGDFAELGGEIPSVPPSYVEGLIEPGQTLSAALVSRGVPAESLNRPISSLSEVFDFRRSQPGHRFSAELDTDGRIVVLTYQTSPETIYETRPVGDVYEARQVEVSLEVEVHAMSGSVESSFIAAVIEAGETEPLAQEIVRILQWDVDFSSETRPGDAFRALYERVYLDGQFLRYGNVLAVEYRGGRAQIQAYYFDEEGHEGHYTPDGEPLERLFLAAPCRYRRISSRYDPHRLHPVLGVRRPHYGVDFAASTGTPVVAAADGEVLFVGVRGGNGNLVRLRHEHGYETGYAHLSGFARGLRAGQDVRQGQLIGYVGSTGLSTGPHLHYAVKHNGNFIDPMGDSFNRRGPPLTGRMLGDFQRRQSQLEAELDDILIADVELEEPTVEQGNDDEMLDFVDGDFANNEF